MRILRWGRKWPHHHRFVCMCVCLCGCVCEQVCAFPDHSLDHNCPRSLQREQFVPSFSATAGLLYSTITSEHWKKQAVLNDELKYCRKRLRQKRKEGKNGVGVGRGVVVGFGGVRPKIRQEMRKENEKNCLPKLWWDATITQAWMRREIRAEENWKETDRNGRVERQREMEKIGWRNECGTERLQKALKVSLFNFLGHIFQSLGEHSLPIKRCFSYHCSREQIPTSATNVALPFTEVSSYCTITGFISGINKDIVNRLQLFLCWKSWNKLQASVSGLHMLALSCQFTLYQHVYVHPNLPLTDSVTITVGGFHLVLWFLGFTAQISHPLQAFSLVTTCDI